MTRSPMIAIAICTLDRPEGLGDLLAALEHQRIVPWPDAALAVVVIDNSPKGGARAACERGATASRFALHYRHEPRRGLSHARNAALTMAQEVGASHVAFIDDDEVPHPDWLRRLYVRLVEVGAAAVAGPVRPVFDAEPPAWCVEGGFYGKVLTEQNGVIQDAYTCNVLVDLAFCREHGLTSFDLRCNGTGGEDTLFFRDLRAAGGIIAWAADALVYEHMEGSRVRAAWLMRRWFRTGGTEAELKSLTGRSGRAFDVARGAARIAAGSFKVVGATLAYPGSRHRRIGALYTLCRGAGLVSSAFGRTYAEYDPALYRRAADS